MKLLTRIRDRFGLSNGAAAFFFFAVAFVYLPIALYFQLGYLSSPLIEPHLRQDQTALTTFYFARHEIPFFDYRSPMDGQLWNEVHELPVYQWICARLMNLGLSLEVASRGVGLLFYFAGLALFALIVRQLFDRQTAAWAALMYAVSPFSISYSRAALIDYPCLFLVFLSFWGLLKALDPERRRFKWWLFVFLSSGALAAAMKATIWMYPAVATGLYLAWLFWKRPEQRASLVWIGTLLIVQGIVAVAWTLYANDIQRLSGTYGRDFWMFGKFSDRLDPRQWTLVLSSLARFVLHDWMIPPLLVGVWFSRRNGFAQAALAVTAVSLVTFLKVHASNQDYYYLLEAPFLFLLAGKGMATICKARPAVRNSALAALFVAIGFKTYKLPFLLGNINKPNNYRLADGLAIKQMTDPTDIILFDENVEGSGYEITLYSERYLFFPNDGVTYTLEPSVFYFDQKRRHFSMLKSAPMIWVDALSSDFYIYRSKPRGPFLYDALKHVAVSDHRPPVGDQLIQPETATFPVNTCQAYKPRYFELRRVPSEIFLKLLGSGKTLVFPGRKFLTLPTGSPLGCHFEITLVEKPVRAGN